MVETVWLFSYGTLQDATVQHALFGRQVGSTPDLLRGFIVETVLISDPAVIERSGSDRHPVLRPSTEADEVAGSALSLTVDELRIADRYEAENYIRTQVRLASGRDAYVYVHKDDALVSEGGVRFSTPDLYLLRRLLPVARQIFTDAFVESFEPEAFQAFCDQTYALGGSMSREFNLPDVHWQVATFGEEPIGYAKLTPLRAPVPQAAPGAMELQQIYVVAAWQGSGVADRLLEWAVQKACRSCAPELYLTVFDHNDRAKRFYARHRFVEVGRCTFELGGRRYDDRIWARTLGDQR